MVTSWQRGISEAAADRVHGASYIAAVAAGALVEACRAGAAPEELRRALRELAAGQPVMAPVLRLAGEAWRALEEEGPPAVERVAAGWREALMAAEQRFVEELLADPPPPGVWALLSLSSVVNRGFEALEEAGPRGEVWVGESRPGGEGIETVRALAAHGRRCTLMPDAVLFDHLARGEVDRVILGCDALDDHHFVNKSGSAALAALAAERGIPVELWTTTHKFLPPGTALRLPLAARQGGGRAVDLPPGVRYRQPLFAAGTLHDGMVIRCEEGALDRAVVEKRVRGIAPLPGAIFDALRGVEGGGAAPGTGAVR